MRPSTAERRGGRHSHEDDFRQADTNSPPDSPRDHGWSKWRTNKLASRLVIALTATFLIGLLIRGPDFGGPPSATKHRLKGTVRLFEKSSEEHRDPPRDDEDDVRIAGEPKEPEQAAHPTETDEDTVQVDKDDKESSQEHLRSFTGAPEADEDLVQVANDVPERGQEQSASSSSTEPDEDIIRVAKDAPESLQELSARSSKAQPDEVPSDADSSQEPSARGNANAELEKDTVQVPTDPPESSQEISTSLTDKATNAGEVASESAPAPAPAEALKAESEVPVKPEAKEESQPEPAPTKPVDVPAVEGFNAVQELPTRRPVSATLAPIPTQPVPAEPEAGRLQEEPAGETAASSAVSQRAGHVAAESVLKRMEKARDEPSPEDAAEAVVSKTESEQTSVRIQVADAAVAVSESASKETGEVRAESAEGSRMPKPEDASVSVEAPLPPKVAAASPEALPPAVPDTTTSAPSVEAEGSPPAASEVHLESATRAPAEIHQTEAEPVSIGQAVETRAEIKAESPGAGSPVTVQTQAMPDPVIDSSTAPPVLVEGSETISSGASSMKSAKPETGEVTAAENFPEASADVRVESEDVQLTDDAAQSATSVPADGTILQQAEGAITRAEAGLKEAEKELAQTGGQVLEQVQKAAAAGQEVLHEVEEETSAVVQAVEKAVVGTGVTGQMLSKEADEVTIASPK